MDASQVMSKSKCVCIFSNFYPPVVSGSAVQVEGLCRELAKHGWEVVVITAYVVEGSPRYEIVDGVHVYRLPALRLPRAITLGFDFPWLSITFKPANIKRIRQIMEKHRPNILHLHNYMFDLAFGAVYARNVFKVPTVLTVHTHLRHPSFFINLIFYLVEQLLLKGLVVRKMDCVICPDMNAVNYVVHEFGNVPTAHIPYGIQLSTLSANTKSDLRKRFNLEGKRVILSLGHLHAMRNRKDLILAMPHILKEIPNAVLLIVGDVSIHLPAEWVKKYDIDGSVIFAGPLQHAEVSGLLELADLEAHWLNQDKPEKTSLGIASLEAMSAGITVLAAANLDTYGKGTLANGENIVIVNPDKPEELAKIILDLLHDDSRRSRIGGCARQTILDHFSWDSVCKQTIQVYESVIKK
jgi:glycosyltransferase involved in cell wall biosynthesis